MSGIWPGDTQCVVMLTFDVDGVSSWLHRDPDFKNLPSLMSMAEYGPSVATPRILDMLDHHSIKSSFYVPGYVAETHVGLVEEIARRGHEVGHHGYMHEPPATLSPEEEKEVLERGIQILQGITGQAPLGYRSPGWELSEHSIEFMSLSRLSLRLKLDGGRRALLAGPHRDKQAAGGVAHSLVVGRRSQLRLRPVGQPIWSYAKPRGGLRNLGRRVRGPLPVRPVVQPHHAPPTHRPSRPVAHAGTADRPHPQLPQRGVHALPGRGQDVGQPLELLSTQDDNINMMSGRPGGRVSDHSNRDTV